MQGTIVMRRPGIITQHWLIAGLPRLMQPTGVGTDSGLPLVYP
jgi:hypothetical protein